MTTTATYKKCTRHALILADSKTERKKKANNFVITAKSDNMIIRNALFLGK